ncbi:MAG: hypothetical protein QOI66_1713 [Myxococcales bacterium]|nr:hypothetical protein [Myxococcales bacterium]
MMAEESSPAACLSELRLDRWVAGELNVPEREDVENHVRGCRRCASRREARLMEKQRFHDTAPLMPFEARPAPTVIEDAAFVSRKRPGFFGSKRAVFGAGSGLAVALAAAFILVPWALAPCCGETVQVKGKGGHRVRFFVHDGAAGTVREGTFGETVHPGDRIRFAFNHDALGDRRVAVLSRDAAGKVSVYFPDGARQTAPPPPSADGLIGYSVQLDETLGPETLYAVDCAGAVALEPMQTALSRAFHPVWPTSCQVETIMIDKKPRR